IADNRRSPIWNITLHSSITLLMFQIGGRRFQIAVEEGGLVHCSIVISGPGSPSRTSAHNPDTAAPDRLDTTYAHFPHFLFCRPPQLSPDLLPPSTSADSNSYSAQ